MVKACSGFAINTRCLSIASVQAAQDAFKMNYEQLVAGVTGLVRCTFPPVLLPSSLWQQVCCCLPVAPYCTLAGAPGLVAAAQPAGNCECTQLYARVAGSDTDPSAAAAQCCKPPLQQGMHPMTAPEIPNSMQVPDSEIEPVQELPRLEDLHAGESADLKVGAKHLLRTEFSAWACCEFGACTWCLPWLPLGSG